MGISDRIPIVFSVTGHRDIAPESIDDITECLTDIFHTAKSQFPHSPLVLLTGLAEGADRIVAKVALDAGIDVYAILPMAADEYEKDFTDRSSVDEFRSLLDSSQLVKVVGEADPLTERDLCYEQLGEWLVDHSDCLVAIWDGEFTGLAGGTGEVVRYALECQGSVKAVSAGGPGGGCVVYHCFAPRISTSIDGKQTPGELRIYRACSDLEPAQTRGSWTGFSFFNGAEKEDLEKIEFINSHQYPEDKVYHLLPDEQLNQCADDLRFMEKTHIVADSIANSIQHRLKSATVWFYVASAFAMVSLILFFEGSPDLTTIVTYIIFFGIASFISIKINKAHWQQKYLNMRTLAELMRVGFFHRLATAKPGGREPLFGRDYVSCYIRRKLGREGRWLMRILNRPVIRADEQTVVSADWINTATRDKWILDQCNYFEKAFLRSARVVRQIDRAQAGLFYVSVIISVVLVAMMVATDVGDEMIGIYAIVIAVSAGLGGVYSAYGQVMGFQFTERQFDEMRVLYRGYAESLETGDTELEEIVDNLAWESLMETVEWSAARRDMKIESFNWRSVGGTAMDVVGKGKVKM